MKIHFELALLLSELYRSISHRTPKRHETIYGFAEEIWSELKNEVKNPAMIVIDVNNNNENHYSSNTMYHLSLESIVKYEQDIPAVISKLRINTFDQILLPGRFYCCDQTLKVIPYYASVALYTLEGLKKCRSYHAKCKRCKTSFYHGFYECGCRRVFEDIVNKEFLMFTTGIAFEKKLLVHFDNMVCIGAMTFEQLKDFYLSLHSVKLNPDRIEANWFLYRIIHYVKSFENWPRKEKSGELNIESLCGDVFCSIKNQIQKKSLEHVCDDVGCKNKFIVIDGNEKLFRAVSATDKEKLEAIPGEVNRVKVCIENPLRGNQYSKVSKYCAQHHKDKMISLQKIL